MAQPIQNQPGGGPPQGWMPAPALPAGCPPGLEYLTMVDQLLCHQVVELLQVIVGWESNNRYVIKNAMGQQIYYVFEETNVCARMCCGPAREFTLHVVNNFNQEVMRIHRPFVCMGGCCWCANCCGFEVTVESPPGTLIGRVKQTNAACTLQFDVLDAQDNAHLHIDGPCLMCRCCSDVEFPVLSKANGQRVGMITKQWTGMVKEMFTQADNFGMNFPMDLDVKMKATMIGALFLIDFMAFENQNQGGILGLFS